MFGWSLSRRVWTTYFLVVLTTAGVMAGRYWDLWKKFGVPDSVVDDLTTALLTFLLVGFFANLLLIRSIQAGIQETVKETLPLLFTADEQKSIFKELGPDTRATIVNQTLRAQLGARWGQLIYSDIVQPYMLEEQDFRRNLTYIIRCKDEAAPFCARDPQVIRLGGMLNENVGDYMWVHQSMSYTREGYRVDDPVDFLRVQFLFSMGELEASFHDSSVFFRETLHVSNSVREQLVKLSQSQLLEFVRHIIHFEAYSPQGNELSYSAHFLAGPEGGQVIEVTIQNPSGRKEGSGCRIDFALPHARDARNFIVTMPKPTEPGAEIVFEKAASMMELSEFSFLSGPSDACEILHERVGPGPGPDRIKIRTRRWMFPISGVMFFWK